MLEEIKVVNGRKYFFVGTGFQDLVRNLWKSNAPKNIEVGVFDMATGEGVSCNLYDDEATVLVYEEALKFKKPQAFYAEKVVL